MFKNQALHELQDELHTKVGRFVLAAAPVLGDIAGSTVVPLSPAGSDVVLALLAGSIFYGVFREELPSRTESNNRWFVAGAALYAALVALATR